MVVALVATGLGLAGCQRNAAPTNAAAPSAAPAAASAASAAAASSASAGPVSQTGETPQAFVTRMLAPYQPNGAWWKQTNTPAEEKAQKAFEDAYDAEFYDADFLKLIDDNGSLAMKKGGGVDMDYDPICQCQDSGTSYHYVSGHPDGQFYDVVVKSDDKEQGTWTFVLADSPRGWKLYNVRDQTGDVRQWLTKHDDCLRAARSEKDGEACIS